MVAKMSMLRTFMCLAATAMLIKLAMATNYTVGGSTGGWDQTTNLQTWASSQQFVVGDNLIFQYSPNHDVLEVSKSSYDSCQSSNPILTDTSGTTTIPLTSPGKRYFICGTAGHCSQGMKVEVDTLAASASPPASPPATPPAASTVTPPITSASPLASPPPASPVTPPAASPTPETAAAPATKSPTSAPKVSPPSRSKAPVSGPTSSRLVPSTESPANSPPSDTSPPPPSSATKVEIMAGSTIGFGFLMMVLLAL